MKKHRKKSLTQKQTKLQAQKYSKLKNKSGAYQKLVGLYGKWEAKGILQTVETFFRKFPKSSIILQPQKLPKSAFYPTQTYDKKKKKYVPISKSSLPKGAKLVTEPPDKDGFVWSYIKTPQFGKSKGYYQFPIVVDIGKRRYEIDLQPRPIDGDLDPDNHPYKGQSWDSGSKRKIIFTPTRKKVTKSLSASKRSLGWTFISLFGQADPIQMSGEIVPVYKGEIARPLMTVYTQWGDDGNEVFWLALDKDGKPAKVFWYASTH